jgi:hypothetical protein
MAMFSKTRLWMLLWGICGSLLLTVAPLQAQRYTKTAPDSTEKFIALVGQLMVKYNATDGAALSERFGQVWSGMGQPAQQKVIQISNELLQKQCDFNSAYKHFYAALIEGTEQSTLNSSQLGNLLDACLSMLQTNINTKTTEEFFVQLYHFYAHQALYYSSYNKVYLAQGSYNIRYEDEPILQVSRVDLALVSPFDSSFVSSTSGDYKMLSHNFIGNGGSFDWANLYVSTKHKNEEGKTQVGFKREYPNLSTGQITCSLGDFVLEAGKAAIHSKDAQLSNGSYFSGGITGSFDFISKDRKKEYVYRNIKVDGKTKRVIIDTLTVADYPKFQSDEDVRITGLGEYVSYQGGFALQGIKGVGARERGLSTLYAERGGEPLFNVRGREFIFEQTRVTAKNTKFSIYFYGGADSVFHTSVDLVYHIDKSRIELIRNKNSVFQETPFINTDHKFLMDVDLLSYDMTNDSLNFFLTTLTDSLLPVTFESFDFYDPDVYTYASSIYDFNPYKIFHNYARKLIREGISYSMYDPFYLEEMAEDYKQDPNVLLGVATDLRLKGALEIEEDEYQRWNPKTETDEWTKRHKITLGYKLVHYVDADKFYYTAKDVNAQNVVGDINGRPTYQPQLGFQTPGERDIYYNYDYDDLRIQSRVRVGNQAVYDSLGNESVTINWIPNASMILGGSNLLVRGVKEFPISHELGVYLVPANNEVQIFSNRTIFMEAGEAKIGDMRFRGRMFTFNYEEFVLDMPEIEDILFIMRDSTGNIIPATDENGNIVYNPVTRQPEPQYFGSEIVYDEAGTMQINLPTNKSGLKQGESDQMPGEFFATYPKLNIPGGGFMNFALETRQDGAYDSTRVKFIMPEVKLDSLYIKEPRFPGIMSCNIFPPFKETLVGLPGTGGQMGFTHHPPLEGYDLYPDRGYVKEWIATHDLGIPQDMIQNSPGRVEELHQDILSKYPEESRVEGAHIRFNEPIVMNKEGMFSSGLITFLSTKVENTIGKRYLFLPKYVYADEVEFKVDRAEKIGSKKASFPMAIGERAKMAWAVLDDSLMIDNREYIDGFLGEDRYEIEYSSRLFEVYGNDGADNFEMMTLYGTLIVKSTGLYGYGSAVRSDFEMIAMGMDPYMLGIDSLVGTQLEFKVNSAKRDPRSTDQSFYVNNPELLKGNFVDLNMSLRQGFAYSQPSEEVRNINYLAFSFPYAKFQTNIQEARWNTATNMIDMQGDSTSIFASTKYGGESYDGRDVRFNGSEAHYNTQERRLIIEGVPYITSADARILPDSGRVVVRGEADIETLRNAKLVIDTLNQYHNLFDGRIKINSRIDFEGNATYAFNNKVDSTIYNIKFDDFRLLDAAQVQAEKKQFENVLTLNDTETDDKKGRKKQAFLDGKAAFEQEKEDKKSTKEREKDNKKNPDGSDDPVDPDDPDAVPDDEISGNYTSFAALDGKRRITVSQGYVSEEAPIYITTGILYYGKVYMFANDKNLALDGYIKMDLKSGAGFNSWIPYKRSSGDTQLPFREKTPAAGQILTAGLHFNAANELYSTFISPMESNSDRDVFLASGELTANPNTGIFQLAPVSYRARLSYVGSELLFNDITGELIMEGPFRLLDSIHSPHLQTVGVCKYNPEKETYQFDSFIALKAPVPPTSVSKMVEEVLLQKPENPYNIEEAGTMTHNLAEIAGDREMKRYFAEKKRRPVQPMEMLPSLISPLNISGVQLHWNDEFRTFYSKGNFMLFSVGNKIVNTPVTGAVEIRKGSGSSDGFSVYVEISANSWYFFEMDNNVLFAVSSNEAFNKDIDARQTKKAKDGQFSLQPAGSDRKDAFMSKFRALYSGESGDDGF